jgi:hypothetical protein
MMEYLKNMILIQNQTLFHVKKSVKMQNLKKIDKNFSTLFFVENVIIPQKMIFRKISLMDKNSRFRPLCIISLRNGIATQ